MGMDVIGIGNKDAYFQASVWTWRPIHALLEYINEKHGMRIDMSGLAYNQGDGIEDPEQCKELAQHVKEEFEHLHLKDPDDKIYLSLGSWVNLEGKSIPQEDVERIGINEQYSGKTISGPISTELGLVIPPYSVTKETLHEFAIFLRICKGFRVC